jgi:predicted DNA-binding transcriptional regulator AlpA
LEIVKMTPRQLLTEHTAAQYIGMSVAFLRAARCRGKVGARSPGPEFLKLGKSVRYDVADLDAWLTSRRRRTTSDSEPAACA